MKKVTEAQDSLVWEILEAEFRATQQPFSAIETDIRYCEILAQVLENSLLFNLVL
jgi:hypothetical protein